jgi:hypothetical protein
MAQSYTDWTTLYLATKLTPAGVLTVTTDPWITTWRLYFQNDNQVEWINFTSVTASWSYFILWWLTRDINPVTIPMTSNSTGKTWLATQPCVIVAMHDQLIDKTQDQTFNWSITATDINFSWTTTPWLKVKSLTTTQRLALTPADWIIVYDSTLWENYQYIAWAWSAISAGSTQPNASTTVAGKVEIATTAQSKSATDIGETLALLSVLPSDIAANAQSDTFKYAVDAEANDTYVIALTPALTAYTAWQEITFRPNTVNTWACTININWLWVKSIKLIDWTDPLDWDFATWVDYTLRYDWINFVLQQVPVRATNAEVLAWTITNKFISPKSARDARVYKLWSTTYDVSTASWVQNIAHWLWVIPKLVKLEWMFLWNWSTFWDQTVFCKTQYDWTTQTSFSIYKSWNPQ